MPTRRGASQHLEEARADGIENESVEQIAFADKLLLNKARLRFAPRLAPAPCLRPPVAALVLTHPSDVQVDLVTADELAVVKGKARRRPMDRSDDQPSAPESTPAGTAPAVAEAVGARPPRYAH